jgi:autotransporter passenger strand-loop-strand repeat protein
MTTFTAPPDQNGLNLGFGDILNVNDGGEATGTTIRIFGVENVNSGGTSIDTTIKRGGVEHVFTGGEADGTILDGGNQEVHSGGFANGTIINDGREFVDSRGTANNTTINQHGQEYVEGSSNNTTIRGGELDVLGGFANNVTFDGPGSLLKLLVPSHLTGTISDWSVGDVVDFRNTDVWKVVENDTHTTVTISYRDETVTYSVANQQANTAFELRSDHHGGTELILTPIVGVPHHEAAIHFGPGPHLFF